MKRLIALLCLLPMSLFGGLNATAVQSATCNSTGTGTCTATLGATPTVGNFLIAVTASNATNALIPLSTNTTWVAVNGAIYNGNGPTAAFIYIGTPRASAGTGVVGTTVSGAASGQVAMVVAEFTGTDVHPDLAVDTATGTSGTASVTVSAGLYPAELLVVAHACRGNWSGASTVFSSPTNSFSIVAQANSTLNTTNNDRAVALLVKLVTSSGSVSAASTIDASRAWAAGAVGIREDIAGFIVQ